MAGTKPLWQVMDDACSESVAPAGQEWQLGHGYAAEIRAIAEWLWNQGTLDEVAARADVIKLIYAEADRAERGEQ